MILIVETYIFIWVLSIFGHLLLYFMEIFQEAAFPDLEYHLFQVVWCDSTLQRKIHVTNDILVETDIFNKVLSMFGHI